MKFLLILQWPTASSKDYDLMINIEEALRQGMSEESEVDGHDIGSGEMNIFLVTKDPRNAFFEIKRILGSSDFWVDARVAYREIAGREYTILWPKDLTEFKLK